MRLSRHRAVLGRVLRCGILLGLVSAAGCEPGGTGDTTGPVTTGTLAVTIQGLGPGLGASVTVTGPGGFQRNLTASETLAALAPGSYTITAAPVTSGGHSWLPEAAQQVVTVAAAASVQMSVGYRLATGALRITVTGLPPSIPQAALILVGPSNSTPITGTTELTGLQPGTYLLLGGDLTAGSQIWTPQLPGGGGAFTVPASLTPVEITVAYRRQTGAVRVSVTGLPPGVAAALELATPGGAVIALSGPGLVADLDPGPHTLVALPVVHLGHQYAPTPTTASVLVSNGGTATVEVGYTIITGGLTVMITGLPPGTPADVRVSGPGGYGQLLTETAALVGLVPGLYTVTAQPVAGHVPSPATREVSVSAGTTPAAAAVTYVTQVGTLRVTISGLPSGAAAAVSVTGPGGFQQALVASQTWSGLVPGTYTVLAASVSAAGQGWAPSPASQTVIVPGGGTGTANVSYAQSTGTLQLAVFGLPAGVAASVTVTGAGYAQTFGGTTTITGLQPGVYTVTAAQVTGGGTFAPSPATQQVSVAAGGMVTATIHYSQVGGPTLNLRIDGAYLTQATQRFDGTVPLVAGRDAYLRVFAAANELNSVTPRVRVRLYHGTTLVQTYTVTAPGSSVPLAVNESSLGSSWNVMVAGALVQPGLRVLADVDPEGVVAESNEGDNTFPVSGVPAPVDVRALPSWGLRFVPVLQQVNGNVGEITPANQESYLVEARRMLPVAASEVDIREVYVTTAPELQSNNGNGAWGTILSELLALKTADGSSKYYYGVVRTNYSSGVAGFGYVGGTARTAVGWDRPTSRAWVLAHEVGHNMGRPHAPGCGAGNPDPGYPYAEGRIGVWGLDVGSVTLKSPNSFYDLMGYCTPAFWVSDYNWSLMVAYRQSGPNAAPEAGVVAGSGARPGLLVWGRLTPRGAVLEPAFVVEAPPSLPTPGPHRIELVGDGERRLLSLPFQAYEVADHTGEPEAAFAFVLPLDARLTDELVEVRLIAGGATAVRRASPAASPPAVRITGLAGGAAELRWDGDQYPMALVRDQATGRIVSFARQGRVTVPPGSGRYQVTVSDGVASRVESLIVPP